MLTSTKRDMLKVIEQVARENGISVEECRREMELAIQSASVNPNDEFTKLFGNKNPSPEEFILKILCGDNSI